MLSFGNLFMILGCSLQRDSERINKKIFENAQDRVYALLDKLQQFTCVECESVRFLHVSSKKTHKIS